MKVSRKAKWIIVAVLLVAFGTTLAFTWEKCLRALIYHRPLRYDAPFHPAIADADRIVVRSGGFDCCHPLKDTNILFQVTDPKDVAAVKTNIRFQAKTTTNAFYETCLCCGCPGIDWYKGTKRIALTAMQHGDSIRWRGFSTTRILGFRVGYGDGPLTDESREWLGKWFKLHGNRKSKEISQQSDSDGTAPREAPTPDSSTSEVKTN